jgi:hypothetical protein
MGSNAQRRREARAKLDEMRKADRAKQRKRSTVLTVVLVLIVAIAIGGIYFAVQAGSASTDATPGALDDVKVYDYTDRSHTTDPVHYKEDPPVGGPHYPTPQQCGIYDQPVQNEKAVHSLEHGAVWVTYDPSLPESDVKTLTDQLHDSYLLVSPYEGQDAPVVATAWNHQLALTGVDDPRLADFIAEYRQGPQTPEPGSPC